MATTKIDGVDWTVESVSEIATTIDKLYSAVDRIKSDFVAFKWSNVKHGLDSICTSLNDLRNKFQTAIGGN